MTYEKALQKTNEAKDTLEKATIPEDVKNIVIQYGLQPEGYWLYALMQVYLCRPAC